MLPQNKLLCLIMLSIMTFSAHSRRFYIPRDSDVIFKMNEEPIKEELNSESFSILVWNMYKGQKSSWAHDYKELIKNIDILMLQEVLTDKKMLESFAEDSQREYQLSTSFFDRNFNYARSGVANASSYRATLVDWRRSNFTEPLVNTPKMLGVNKYKLSGSTKELLTLNIHAINFVSVYRLQDMIEQAIEVFEAHTGPVVFAGDFNTWSPGKLQMVRQKMKENDMHEVQFSPDGRMRTFGNILDFVFVRELEVQKSLVHAKIEGSDHKAMQVTLSYRDSEKE